MFNDFYVESHIFLWKWLCINSRYIMLLPPVYYAAPPGILCCSSIPATILCMNVCSSFCCSHCLALILESNTGVFDKFDDFCSGLKPSAYS